jgi:hypothetical protein
LNAYNKNMAAWLAVLILISGATVFLGSLVYLCVFLRARNAIGDILGLQRRASIGARLAPKEAQEELAAVLSDLQERLTVAKHPIIGFSGSTRRPDPRTTRLSGKS